MSGQIQVNVTEDRNQVTVSDEVIRVVTVATRGPQGPPGEQGPMGEIGDLPEAETMSLMATTVNTTWGAFPVGDEGQVLTTVDGDLAWVDVEGGGGESIAPFGAVLPNLSASGGTHTWTMPGYSLTAVPSGQVLSTTDMHLVPIYLDREMLCDFVAVTVGLAEAGAVMRLGLYAAAFGLRPGGLLADFGTIDAGTTGVKSISLAGVIVPAGYAFMACVSNSANARAERVIATAIVGNIGPVSTHAPVSTGVPRSKAYRVTQSSDWITNGLPNPAPSPTNSNDDVMFMRLRFANT